MPPTFRSRRASAVLLAAACAGCGPEFDRVSELETLRVLAVQKSEPYARPGEEVSMAMLWHDATPGEDPAAPRPIQRTWISGCFNPLGDQYFGCFGGFGGGALGEDGDPELVSQLLNMPAGDKVCLPVDGLDPDSVCVGSGDLFSFDVPSNLISSRPPPPDPSQPRYGLGFVFFAVCAGRLELLEGAEGNAFPLACRGEDGELLGADDFVAGYSAVYAYDAFRNGNPEITGFEFEGTASPVTCLQQDCLAQPVNRTSCAPDALPVPVCTRSDDDDCPGHEIRPLIDPSQAETDSVTAEARDRELSEQMWINYYVDRGSLKSEVRLLNDATAGFNDDYGTEFRAPREPGPVSIWAVVHDNRGGVGWVRSELCAVEE